MYVVPYDSLLHGKILPSAPQYVLCVFLCVGGQYSSRLCCCHRVSFVLCVCYFLVGVLSLALVMVMFVLYTLVDAIPRLLFASFVSSLTSRRKS